jgi:Lon protease-like protein
VAVTDAPRARMSGRRTAVRWAEMGERLDSFPLFPLGIVMLPSEIVPLHIFEERYKQMIGECLDQEREFGIVWLSDDELHEVGCAGRITQVLERAPDGRMNILVRGSRPFRLLERIPDLPYPAGSVELLDDDEPDAPEDVLASARERYAALVERVTDRRPEDEELDALDAYGMAATIEFAPEPKQRLLEERSEPRRLELVAELLDSTLRKLDQSDRAGELAKTNGKLR